MYRNHMIHTHLFVEAILLKWNDIDKNSCSGPYHQWYSKIDQKSIKSAHTRTSFHALSYDFEEIITSSSLHFEYFLIGLNKSSCQAPFKTVLLFQKIKLF